MEVFPIGAVNVTLPRLAWLHVHVYIHAQHCSDYPVHSETCLLLSKLVPGIRKHSRDLGGAIIITIMEGDHAAQ